MGILCYIPLSDCQGATLVTSKTKQIVSFCAVNDFKLGNGCKTFHPQRDFDFFLSSIKATFFFVTMVTGDFSRLSSLLSNVDTLEH